MGSKSIKCSIGITAYNEEANISVLLDALLAQELSKVSIDEIIVVCSGCIDNTEKIVEEFRKKDKRIQCIHQEKREGKSSAINLFLKIVKNDICIIESADTLPLANTVEKLVSPLEDSSIGICGVHPIPVDKDNNFIGFVVNLQWKLHHLIALQRPKLGEMVAFRKIMKEIPVESSVDEVSIESIILKSGLKSHYVPEAIVYNKGPETIDDFLKQRRRIHAGHLWSAKTQSYAPSSMNWKRALWLTITNTSLNLKHIIWTLGAVLLEFYGRMLGRYDFYIKKKSHTVWSIAKTTKKFHDKLPIVPSN